MALFISSLNSGSNGNCYYIGNDKDAILVDAGISCREIEKRIKQLKLSMKTVKAIFISHEHGDHIRGVSTLANKYHLPVYITPKTAKNGPRLIGHLTKSFVADEAIQIGGLTVTPFCKNHDAVDPHSFIVQYELITIGIFTDIGVVCENLIRYFKLCNAAFLEANYDEEMLEHGKYPIYLKNRIRNGQGHLSNKQALDLYRTYRPGHMTHLLLAHLSKENNCPKLVNSLFSAITNQTAVTIASRYQATDLCTIGEHPVEHNRKKENLKPQQLAMFNL